MSDELFTEPLSHWGVTKKWEDRLSSSSKHADAVKGLRKAAAFLNKAYADTFQSIVVFHRGACDYDQTIQHSHYHILSGHQSNIRYSGAYQAATKAACNPVTIWRSRCKNVAHYVLYMLYHRGQAIHRDKQPGNAADFRESKVCSTSPD